MLKCCVSSNVFLGLFWAHLATVLLNSLQTEEELKRLKQETNGGGYSQVGHTYDEPKQSGPEFSNSPTCEEPEQIFQLPLSFYVPPDMHLVSLIFRVFLMWMLKF